MGNLGGTNTVNQQPSPFDAQKAQMAELMRTFLMPNIQAGISGQAMPGEKTAFENTMQQARYNAGRFGMPAGTPQFKDMERMASEGVTEPNKDMMKLAMSMYSGSQPQGVGSSTSTASPGLLQEGMSAAQLAMIAAMLAG